MMLVNVILISALIWRVLANQAQQENTVNAVLNDYAAMAGQNLVRTIKGQIGYQSMYQLSQIWASAGDPSGAIMTFLNRPENELEENLISVRNALSNIQVIDVLENKSIAIKHSSLAELSTPIPDLDTGNQYGFKAIHSENVNDLSFSSLINTNTEFAILANFEDGFTRKTLEKIIKSQQLMPSVINPTNNNQGLVFIMFSPSGQMLWQSKNHTQTTNSHTIAFDDDYGALFKQYSIKAIIDKSLAESLIIGGLPKNQLPKLLILAALTFLSIIITFWLYRRAQRFSQQQQQFIARVSHELRTPLTQIRLFAETLELNRVNDEAAKKHYLGIIHQESIRLSQLVDNILNQQQIQQANTHVNLKYFKLKPFIEELISEQQILWQSKNITFEIKDDTSISLNSDPNLLKQVMINLLENAVKFGPKEHPIQIELNSKNSHHIIKITDQGPGIPESLMPEVLNSYQRLPRDEIRGINGNGLGLGIAVHLTQVLGGTLLFEHPQKGLVAVITIPSEAPEQATHS